MPGRKWYWLAGAVAIVGIAAFVFLLVSRIGGIDDKISQMLAPGKVEMVFAEPGTYTIFHEHESIFQERHYSSAEVVSGLGVRVVSGVGGAPVKVVAAGVDASYTLEGRSGVAILETKRSGFIDHAAAMAVSAKARPYKDGLAAYERDYATALQLWRPLAEQGDAEAQNRLGGIYFDGRGVPQDYVQAHMWFNLAASRSPPGEFRDGSAKARDNLATRVTPAQIAEVQRLAREWKPK